MAERNASTLNVIFVEDQPGPDYVLGQTLKRARQLLTPTEIMAHPFDNYDDLWEFLRTINDFPISLLVGDLTTSGKMSLKDFGELWGRLTPPRMKLKTLVHTGMTDYQESLDHRSRGLTIVQVVKKGTVSPTDLGEVIHKHLS